MPDDRDVLREYVERGSEEAFRTLVKRHASMVHGTALRVLRNESMAEEVTQAVFIILARKASSLTPKTVLAGWLYRTAHFVALESLRTETRRRQRDHDFAEMKDESHALSVWNQIAPILEDAMKRLSETDRDAVVLRFLEQRSFADVASALSISEGAAKMRVGRALEKLRSALARRGVLVPAAALLAALSTQNATAAPTALMTTVTASALAQPGGAPSSLTALVKGALTLMFWNKAKICLTAVILMLLVSGGAVAIWKWKSSSHSTTTIVTMQTFEPMAGDWEGTISLRRDSANPIEPQPCSMTVTTSEGGRACDIELRMRMAPDADPVVQHYAHKLNMRGDGLFTISDPASGRGDGECQVTESFYNPASGEWRAAMRFPFPGNRGVMEGSWQRRGETLIVQSHDQFFGPGGPSNAYAELQLRRRLGASAAP